MAISSPGIGSGLDVTSIVSQLMAVESQPLALLSKKEAAFQAKLTALGSLKGALSSFQGAAHDLASPARFQLMAATSFDPNVVKASAGTQAAPGSYQIHVSQLAQSQTIFSSGRESTTATIGSGAVTTLTFQFGKIEGGAFMSSSSKLSASVAANGIPSNSLSINGTVIATDTSVRSAKSLAEKINLATSATGVTATAAATDSGALGVFTTTSGSGSYTLTVGGVYIISGAAAGTTAAAIDSSLQDPAVASELSNAGISCSGSAADGTLRFTRADGSNIAIQETGAGVNGGFTSSIGIGKTRTFTSHITLSSAAAISAGGTNPSAAGLTAGTLPNTYSGASFIQDASAASGTVTIDNTNNTLPGIRDAINKANVGVTATIVSDGSSEPHRLVISSGKTGISGSMKISVSGDATIAGLLAYDPAGTQNMKQSSAAQNTELSVNGVAVSSDGTSVSDAIQGVTLNVAKTGSSSVTVSRDTAAVTASVNAFVKAFNDVNKIMTDLTAYNAETKKGAVLTGDSTVRSIQAALRRTLGASLENAGGSLRMLSQIGVSFQKDGSLSVDSSKLQKAITHNFDDIADLFAPVGKPTDSLISFHSAGPASKAGKYEVYVTSLANQGKTAGSSPAGLTIAQGANDQLSVTVNGTSASVQLVSGSYTIGELVSHVQAAINGNGAFSRAGISVSVTADASNVITITSDAYGSSSTVSIGGNGADSLLGPGRTNTAGRDVAGKIGGITATGSGQELIGAKGTPTEGLRITVKGGAENTSRGTLNFSQGYAYQLEQLVSAYLAGNGMVAGRTEGLNSSIRDLGRQRDAVSLRLQATEKRYRAQFAALDRMISSMNKTSSFLQEQMSILQ